MALVFKRDTSSDDAKGPTPCSALRGHSWQDLGNTCCGRYGSNSG